MEAAIFRNLHYLPGLVAVVVTLGAGESALAQADIVGSWGTACISREFTTKNSITFKADGTFEQEGDGFFDSGCASQAASAKTRGTYSVGEEGPVGSGQHALNFRVGTATLTLLTNAAAVGANLVRTCGLTGWQAGVARDITGRDCGSTGKIPERNGVLYDILRLRGGELVFGKSTSSLDRMATQRRPTSYDDGMRYRRIRP
jgi:hypothetical protein